MIFYKRHKCHKCHINVDSQMTFITSTRRASTYKRQNAPAPPSTYRNTLFFIYSGVYLLFMTLILISFCVVLINVLQTSKRNDVYAIYKKTAHA